MNLDLITVLGWTGTFLILGAYVLAATNTMPAHHPINLLLNIVGCTLVCVQMFSLSVWNALFLNLIWGSLALGTLVWRWWRSKH